MNTGNTTYEELRLENQICFPLYSCAKEVVRQYRKPLEELNLTYTQYIVMMALWEHGTMTEKELGRILHLESSTLAPLLKRLEKTGYINRIRPETNERILMLSLTEEGRNLKEKARAVPAAMKECIRMSDEEKMLLKDMLNRALSDLEQNQA